MTRPVPSISRPRRGLSLIEVLVAIAICAGAVLAGLALFGPAVAATREVADRRTAQRLAERIDGELARASFGAVTSATAGSNSLVLVADSAGTRIVLAADADNDPVAGTPPGIPAAQRYFHITVARAPRPEATAAYVVLEVRVRWPHLQPPDGAAVPEAQRMEFRFHTALVR